MDSAVNSSRGYPADGSSQLRQWWENTTRQAQSVEMPNRIQIEIGTMAVSAARKSGRKPKYGGRREQITLRLPYELADIAKRRRTETGRESLIDQLVADLAELYGVDLTTLTPSPETQERLPMTG